MKICYINISNSNSRDRVTIKGLRDNGVDVIEITDDTAGFQKFIEIKKKLSQAGDFDQIVVGYTGAILVPWIWLLSKKPIAYNALASFYESMIVSRGAGAVLSFLSIKYFIIDLLAFITARKILVESNPQKEYLSKLFRISPKKLIVHLSGVDENVFFFDPKVTKSEKFTVVFRGKFTPEAGVDVLLRAAKKLENSGVYFKIIGHGFLQKDVTTLYKDLNPKNVEMINEYLSDQTLREEMLKCHLSLGQLSKHPRLERTIPFKSFESLNMRLPYLTARNKAILEILTEDKNSLCFEPGDHDDLAQKILLARNDHKLLETIATNGYTLFQNEFTATIIGKKLLGKLTLI